MSKIILPITGLFMSLIFVLIINTGLVSAFDPAPNQVILYEHKDYGGMSIRFAVGDQIPNLKNVRMGTTNWNDKVYSVKVVANSILLAWEHANYQGQCIVFLGTNAGGAGNYRRLSDYGFNDKMSSLKVYDKSTNARCP